MVKIRSIELRLVSLPLVTPFRTSFGRTDQKECVLARVVTDHAEGWGECIAFSLPRYSEEFNAAVWLVLRDILGPALLEADTIGVENIESLLATVRGNPMAKALLVNAVLDAQLREESRSLAAFLGATSDRVICGVSVGLASSTESLLEQVDGYLADGYRRIKLKIEPGVDVERVAAVRKEYPDILLSVDANAAYSMADVDVFRELDDYDLLMIEQPFPEDDLRGHAALQRAIQTDICLDESIRSVNDVELALELGACRVVNIKQGRVGGLLAARRVHDICRRAGIPVWCGGMLETGVGRAANLAMAALPGFVLPNDTSPSARYFGDDLTEPFIMANDGTIAVPRSDGIGVVPRPERLDAVTVEIDMIRPR